LHGKQLFEQALPLFARRGHCGTACPSVGSP
jgi:hypothetical protein